MKENSGHELNIKWIGRIVPAERAHAGYYLNHTTHGVVPDAHSARKPQQKLWMGRHRNVVINHTDIATDRQTQTQTDAHTIARNRGISLVMPFGYPDNSSVHDRVGA